MINIDYLYNKAAAQKFFDKNHFSDKKLSFQIIEQGIVLPHKYIYVNGQCLGNLGGIIDRKGEFVESSSLHRGFGGAYIPFESINRSAATVVYFGLSYPTWGHVITDNIRRVWFLKSDVFREYLENCPVVYIAWEEGACTLERQKNFRRLLEILEVNVDRLQPINEPTQFDNIILPDESFFRTEDKQRKFTAEYCEMIDRIRNFALKNRTPTAAKKIYCFHGKRQIGEERLAEYFRSKGYEIFSPEKLTLDEQLNALINAENFASTLGSCSMNSVFLRDDAKAVLIPRTGNYFTGYNIPLNQVHPSDVSYVNSSLSIFGGMKGPNCFIISRQLKNFLGDKFTGYSDDDFKNFLLYLKRSMTRGLKVNSAAEEYYGEVFMDFLLQLKQREDLQAIYGVNLS